MKIFFLSLQGDDELSGQRLTLRLRYATALIPGVIIALLAVLINAHQEGITRTQRVADHARLAATSVDLRLGDLLELTAFCASAPALTERLDLASVAENCGRYASRIGAWVVIVETGETHRQILNTRPDAPSVLPSYPRGNEHATLRVLEERSRLSGAPGIAEVFTGIIFPSGIVSAGQHLRLADGRSVMLYVSVPAQTLSEQLIGLAADGGPIFGLIDPSHRVVARSVGIDRMMFADAPDWIIGLMEQSAAGAVLGVPGPDVIGGTWDAGYHPLSAAPGWMAAAFQPTPTSPRSWTLASLPTVITLLGLLLSGLLLWVMTDRDWAARRVEKAQRDRAEAERRNQEKSRLLAAFAHDIRSPLVSLIGSLEMIEERRRDDTDQIRTARGSAEALLQLVDDILELSFLGSGELTLHPSPVDLRQLALALSDQTRPLAGRKGLTLQLDLDQDLPTSVEVDRLRLQQVLSNLLTNAVKYTEEGSVTLRICQEGVQAGRVTLRISVIDTGIGLTPDEIPKILREFGRLEREAERREQGAGLGLAIVQRILSGMGSALEVESVAGMGSTFGFCLTLPIAIGGEATDPARPLADIFILYAEDEPVIRQVTARRLEAAGARVMCAVDGEDTLRHLGVVKPDVLLIDLQMPGLDGVGLIHRLREIAPDRPYPIFVLTSHISGPQAAEARAAGAEAVFTKPVQVTALAAAFQARRGDGGRSPPLVRGTADGTVEPLLDQVVFGELVAMMGAATVASLVTRFEDSIRTDLSGTAIRGEVDDPTRLRTAAHQSLGLCHIMGAPALAGQFIRIERAAAEADIRPIRSLLNEARVLLEATLKDMRAALQRADT